MSISELRSRCQNMGHNLALSEAINRKFSIYITAILIHTSLTANQVSFIAMCFGLLGSVFLVLSSPILALVGGFFFLLGEVLDCCDGEIARYRKQSSLTGLYIDRMTGLIVGAFQYVFVGYMVYQMTGDVSAFAFAFAASISRPIATLTSHHMQVSAFEPLLYAYRSKDDIGSLLEKVRREQKHSFVPDLDGIGVGKQSWLMSLAWFFYNGSGRHILLMAVIVIDMLQGAFGGADVIYETASGIYLIWYGVLSMVAWMGMTVLIIRRRSTEACYLKMHDGISKSIKTAND